MRGTRAKMLMRLVKQGVAEVGETITDDENKSYWYKLFDKISHDGNPYQKMGNWFRHPKSVRARYQRAKVLYKKGLLNV